MLYTPSRTGSVAFATTQLRGFVADDTEITTELAGVFGSWSHTTSQGSTGLSVVNAGGNSTFGGFRNSNGITYGYREAESISESYIDANGNVVNQSHDLNGALVHWILGPTANPHYLPQILTGSVVYDKVGGSRPSNQSGATGTLNSASLTADFTRQSVSVAIDAEVGSSNWLASLTDYPITAGGFSTVSCPICPNPDELSVTLNGSSAFGAMSGAFTGDGLDGAMLAYSFHQSGSGGTGETIDGVASFAAATTVNSATPYRQMALATPDLTVTGNSGYGGVIAQYVNSGRVMSDTTGITAMDATPLSPMQRNTGVTPLHLSLGASQVVDGGADPLTGVSWGRWSGSSYSAESRIDGTTTSVTNVAGLHYVIGPELAAPMQLPVSGSYSYNLVGGTTPMNQAGAGGTLNSATLDANFTTSRVTAGVNVTVDATTMNALATNLPIRDFGHFGATEGGTVPLTITCTGTCGAVQRGTLAGSFTGPTGGGAGFAYNLESSGLGTTQTIGGVAAFRR